MSNQVIIRKPSLMSTQSQSRQEERPQADIWLNVGYYVPVLDDQGNQVDTKFVSLRLGIPIDTMELETVPPPNGNNEDYRALIEAKNALQLQLKEAGSKLAPGQGVPVNLELQLYRRASRENTPIPAEKNPYLRKISIGFPTKEELPQ